jgi:protein involved in temperature-dependent protein secretion
MIFIPAVQESVDLRSLESKMKYLNRDMVWGPADVDARNG